MSPCQPSTIATYGLNCHYLVIVVLLAANFYHRGILWCHPPSCRFVSGARMGLTVSRVGPDIQVILIRFQYSCLRTINSLPFLFWIDGCPARGNPSSMAYWVYLRVGLRVRMVGESGMVLSRSALLAIKVGCRRFNFPWGFEFLRSKGVNIAQNKLNFQLPM